MLEQNQVLAFFCINYRRWFTNYKEDLEKIRKYKVVLKFYRKNPDLKM